MATLANLKRSLCVLLLSAGVASANCDDSHVDLKGDWGTARFSVEIADTDAERAQGLMNRPSMPRGAGMLFVYPYAQSVSFWMRNTLIPLDMLFIDPDGAVLRIHENAIPLDETGISGGRGVLAVLEINGGLSSDLGINVGTVLRHPAFDGENAVWPCDAN